MSRLVMIQYQVRGVRYLYKTIRFIKYILPVPTYIPLTCKKSQITVCLHCCWLHNTTASVVRQVGKCIYFYIVPTVNGDNKALVSIRSGTEATTVALLHLNKGQRTNYGTVLLVFFSLQILSMDLVQEYVTFYDCSSTNICF